MHNEENIARINSTEDIDENELESTEENTDKEETALVAELKTEIANLKDSLLRSVAESENTRRRYDKQLEETRNYAFAAFSKDLISVMDNFNRALEHPLQEVTQEVENVLTGVEMTKTELGKVFKKYGIVEIHPKSGDIFDCKVHHAISQVPSAKYNEGVIVDLMQVGYKLKERLLRPAIVSVAKAAEGN